MSHVRRSRTIVLFAAFASFVFASCIAAPVVLAATPEEPVTEAATSVSASEAVLNGVLNPGVSAGAVRYRFAYSVGGSSQCTESGFSTPEGGGEASGSKQGVSAAATGLEPNREYSFCLIASDPVEESESSQGATLKFKTAGVAPSVVSESSSSATPFAGVLEAVVNPNNEPTFGCHFEYGALTVSENAMSCSPGSLEGFAEQAVSAAVSGLSPSTVYRYRVVVENASGTTEGPEQEFSTLPLEAPIVSSESTVSVSPADATVQAVVNPDYQETGFSFEYAPTEQTVSEGKGTQVPGAPPAMMLPAVYEELTGGPVDLGGDLTPRTTYFYRALATNASGTTPGAIEHFTTTGTPVVTTAPAQSPTRTTVSLSGTVDPGGETTTYHLAYTTAADYQPGEANPYTNGLTTANSTLPATDFTAHQTVPVLAIELRPGTTYHYALVASNQAGTTIGPDMSFTTAAPTPPVANTGPASAISQTSATLSGSVDTRELPTVSQFEFGSTPGAGSLIPASPTPGTGTLQALTANIPGNLHPDTTYFYRTVATNADGTTYGQENSFTTTAMLPAVGAPPPPVSLVAWPAFVQKELAGPPPAPSTVTPRALTKAQKLARALKACNKKPRRKRASCRHKARRHYK